MTARGWTHGKLHPEGPVGNNARGRLRFGNGQHQMQICRVSACHFWDTDNHTFPRLVKSALVPAPASGLTESGGDGPSAIVKLVAVNAASPLRCRDQSYRRTRSSRWDQDQR
jgi:hypothetical protein